MNLTIKAIKAIKYRGGWDVHWDGNITGLGLRVYPSGKKAFVLSYRSRGRKRLMVLGKFGVMTVDEARIKARKLLVEAGGGDDPLESQRRAAQGNTFGELSDAYIERHAKVHKRSWKEDQRRLRRLIPANWRSRRVDGITRGDVAALHSRVGADHPYEANRLLALLKLMFRLASQWGFMEEGAPNVATGVTKFKESSRKRWVTPAELPPLAQAIDRESNVYVRAALWLLLLTGMRKNEVLQAKREDVDWKRGVLRLPTTKAGEEQSVTLNGPALAIMQSVPTEEDNPYLLPGAKRGRPLVNIDVPWRRVRSLAGLSDVRLHDLRRTTGSWLSQAGEDLNLIKNALRHADLSTTLVYARLGEDAPREAMEAHGRRILEAAGKSGPVEVIEGGES